VGCVPLWYTKISPGNHGCATSSYAIGVTTVSFEPTGSPVASAPDASPALLRACRGHSSPLFSPWSRFTDDTVLTIATAHVLLTGQSYADAYYEFGNRYPRAGYGGAFRRWLSLDDRTPYGSFGNGSAMRVGPVGLATGTVDNVLAEAERSAAVTHDHAEGIRGAQAVALATFLARTGHSKDAIRREIEAQLGYDLSRTLGDIRPRYEFDVTCQGSVPEAITAFLESDGVESAIRLAISLGGDADTQAAIAGGIAEAFHGGVPEAISAEVLARLPPEFRDVIAEFGRRFGSRVPINR
jgi:ADP-ribosylglycohydrolase